jgi:hypothetical protein
MPAALIAARATLWIGYALAEDASPPLDKSDYDLFNPAPDDQLRPFSTDRPGRLQSPLTVDAGHFQVESDIATYTYDQYAGQTTRIETVAAPLLKLGIANWADLEFGMTLYDAQRVTDEAARMSASAHGFGDLTLGTKINLFGNDGGDTALAILPTVKLPTAAAGLGNNGAEFMVNLPFTQALAGDWTLNIDPGGGSFRNLANSGYRVDFMGLVGVSHSVLADDVTLAMEVYVFASGDRREPGFCTFDPSLAWLVAPNLQLDVGAYLGINRPAPQWHPFIGVSARL